MWLWGFLQPFVDTLTDREWLISMIGIGYAMAAVAFILFVHLIELIVSLFLWWREDRRRSK